MKRSIGLILAILLLLPLFPIRAQAKEETPATLCGAAQILREDWAIYPDPDNRGENEEWFCGLPGEGVSVDLPATSANVHPYAVSWFARRFVPGQSVEPGQRAILHFEACQYIAKVWLNGCYLGDHEGSYGKFSFDVTALLLPEEENLLVVRLYSAVEGATVRGKEHNQLPQWGTRAQYIGVAPSLTVTPEVAIVDLSVSPQIATGELELQMVLSNPTEETFTVRAEGTVYAPEGAQVAQVSESFRAVPGLSRHTVTAKISNPRLWSPDHPNCYTVSLTTHAEDSPYADRATRLVGFSECKLDNEGFFRLNGERFYLKSCHVTTWSDGVENSANLWRDTARFKRQMDAYKAAGFNAVRFLGGPAMPELLDYCDKIGLLVYEETAMSWKKESTDAEALMQREIRQLLERDRNHPSFLILGLLNETKQPKATEGDSKSLYRSAVDSLDLIRRYDESVLVLLSSGRWDEDTATGSASNPGSRTWDGLLGDERQRGATEGGDVHYYPNLPYASEAAARIGSLGGRRAAFLSEAGAGSASNIIRAFTLYQQTTRGAYDRLKTNAGQQQAALEALWPDSGLSSLYPLPEDLIFASERLSSAGRGLLFDYIRANPQINGYSLTMGLDAAYRGEGVLEPTGEYKAGMFSALIDGWNDTRLCLTVSRPLLYRSEKLSVRLSLSDLGALPAGSYPVTLRLCGEQGTVWEQSLSAEVRRSGSGDPIFATSVFHGEIDLSGLPAGKYRLGAYLTGLGRGAVKTVTVMAREDLPALSGTVYQKSMPEEAIALLEGQGLTVLPFDGKHIVPGSLVLLGGKNLNDTDREALWESVRESGTRVAVVNLKALGDWGYLKLPTEDAVAEKKMENWLYHYDTAILPCVLTEGLESGLMDPNVWGDLWPTTGLPLTTAVQTPALQSFFIGVTGGKGDGTLDHLYPMAAVRYGEGEILVHTLPLLDHIGNPVADRLLCNLILWGGNAA